MTINNNSIFFRPISQKSWCHHYFLRKLFCHKRYLIVSKNDSSSEVNAILKSLNFMSQNFETRHSYKIWKSCLIIASSVQWKQKTQLLPLDNYFPPNLTHFNPVFHLYTPWKQKNGSFFVFSGVYRNRVLALPSGRKGTTKYERML